MIRHRRVYGVVTGLLVCSMLGILGRDASAAEEEARRWKLYGIIGIENCKWNCDPIIAGCAEDPDCLCACFR